MMRYGVRLRRNLILFEVLGTKVTPLKIVNKIIEIAPPFLMLVPSVTSHRWACLVNRTGPRARDTGDVQTGMSGTVLDKKLSGRNEAIFVTPQNCLVPPPVFYYRLALRKRG